METLVLIPSILAQTSSSPSGVIHADAIGVPPLATDRAVSLIGLYSLGTFANPFVVPALSDLYGVNDPTIKHNRRPG